MLKLITFLYGKPCETDGSFKAKYFRLFYWFMVMFFTFGLVSAIIMSFFNVSMIPATLLGIVLIPLVSRLVYSVNFKLQGLKREI